MIQAVGAVSRTTTETRAGVVATGTTGIDNAIIRTRVDHGGQLNVQIQTLPHVGEDTVMDSGIVVTVGSAVAMTTETDVHHRLQPKMRDQN